MHRRFLFPLAAGIVGLVAVSPALAAGPATTAGAKGSSPAKATTSTTARSAPKGGATSTTMSGSGGSGMSGSGGSATSTTATTGAGAQGAGSQGSGSGGSTATTAPSSGDSTATTAPPSGSPGGTGGAPGSTSSCAPPQTDQAPAPQVGEPAQNHAAGDAGTVDIERLSPSELRIAKVNANNGWQETVTAPSGPRVTVKFTRSGASPTLVRLAASMDQAGRMIHIRVQSCG